MPSGGKQLVVNNLERALSVDINRLQSFLAADRSELFRFLWGVGIGRDDLDAGGVFTEPTALGSPLTAEVVNGFCARPGAGSSGSGLDILVDPGVLAFVFPDGDTDSSGYKIVRDPGLSAVPSSLQMTANSSGATRIDVIECGYASSAVETDNRDVFNPGTNTFAAVSLTKAIQGSLIYRVRAGTPGGGFPGTVSGWLPLAVASVPTATTTNDTITFWDVRPLLADRVQQPFSSTFDYPRWHHANYVVDTSLGGSTYLLGTVEATATDIVNNSPSLRRLGGRLRSSGITDAAVDGVDLNSANNWSSTITTAVGYMYLAEGMFGLPRWARYAAAPGVRTPRNPRGFVVVSTTPPCDFYGAPSAAIALPASTGLAGSFTKGVCFGAVNYVSGHVTSPSICDGRTQWNGSTALLVYPTSSAVITGSSPAFTATFALRGNVTHLSGAKALYVTVEFTLTTVTAAGLLVTATIGNAGGGIPLAQVQSSHYPLPGGGAQFFSMTLRVPWYHAYPAGGNSSPARELDVNFSNTTGVLTSTMTVLGWDLF